MRVQGVAGVKVIRTLVETSFDTDEFLEGAKDAFHHG